MEPTRRLVVGGLAAAIVVAAIRGVSAARQPTLEELLSRVSAYLLDYEGRLSTLVAEERSEQEVTRWLRSPERTGRRPRKRVLTSDYVLLREPGAQAWVGFRDTFLVDGEPVRNRDDRLERLFREGQADALERARLILEQNARYNLAEDIVHRTINAPTLTLDLLHPRHRSRFSFRQHGQDTIDGQRLWKVDFTEHTRPSLIQTPGGAGQVTRGTAWIEPATGSILRTYLNVVISDRSTEAKVTVNYLPDSTLGFLVPSEMRESYEQFSVVIQTVARYMNFRQFRTSGRILEK